MIKQEPPRNYLIPFCLFTSAILFLTQCQKHDAAKLFGTWKVDSVYTYYNGFNMTVPAAEPIYHFQTDGRLRMTLGKEFRYFQYEIRNDTLAYHSADNKVSEKFLIENLGADQLSLKKNKSPLFKGKKQERYEVKYFSRVEE